MSKAVEGCLDNLVQKADELNVDIKGHNVNLIGDIVDISGPRRLILGIRESLSRMLDRDVEVTGISSISEPKLTRDVLVLPIYAFADSMNQQFGYNMKGWKFVIYHYAGSWKKSRRWRLICGWIDYF